MELGLAGKTVIVTGASQGLGQGIAAFLRDEGANVVITARSADKLSAFAAQQPEQTHCVAANLRETGAAAHVVKEALERFGRIDGLVNNAGATKSGTLVQVADEDWDAAFELKFMAAVRLARECWPELIQTQGSIVNIIGIAGLMGLPMATIGGCVNAAMMSLTKTLGQQGIKDGVRVNGVSPGLIEAESSMVRVNARAKNEGISVDEAKLAIAHHLGVARLGTKQELAALVAFLLSDVSGYCQSSVFEIDGGQNRAL